LAAPLPLALPRLRTLGRLAAAPDPFGSLDEAAPDWPFSRNPMLTEVAAVGRSRTSGSDAWTIPLPTGWARKLVSGSVKVAVGDHSDDAFFVGRARLQSGGKVSFVARRAETLATPDLRAVQMLSSSGVVPMVMETHTFPHATFVLSERQDSVDLDTLIYNRLMGDNSPFQPLMPIEWTLAIMIDLLRGAARMADLGLAHGDLTERKILITTEDRRALITGFKHCCFAHSMDKKLCCGGPPETLLVGSAFRYAPEMEIGHPTGSSNNVWQLGLIFALLLFGDIVPTQLEVMRWAPPDAVELFNDRTVEGRRFIRTRIRERFDIKAAPGYQRLYKGYADALRVLEGMLQVETGRRWTARGALDELKAVARSRGVAVPAPRSPLHLSAGAFDDWQ